jgi:hypothetical protein
MSLNSKGLSAGVLLISAIRAKQSLQKASILRQPVKVACLDTSSTTNRMLVLRLIAKLANASYVGLSKDVMSAISDGIYPQEYADPSVIFMGATGVLRPSLVNSAKMASS